MAEEVTRVRCSFDDCKNDGKYFVRARTDAGGVVRIAGNIVAPSVIQAMVCEACKPRLSQNTKDISMSSSVEGARR